MNLTLCGPPLVATGYRDAQTGWLLVQDSTSEPSTGGRQHKRKKGRSSSSSGGRERSLPGETGKRAQCLCLYLPRRGLLEVKGEGGRGGGREGGVNRFSKCQYMCIHIIAESVKACYAKAP